MLCYHYETRRLDEDTIELSLPDFPDFCVVSYSEQTAARYAARALVTVIETWMRIGYDVPRPRGLGKSIELPLDLALKLSLYWEERDRRTQSGRAFVDGGAVVVQLDEMRERLRAPMARTA